MNCNKCKKLVEINEENLLVRVEKSGNEDRVELELICDNKECGEEVAFSFVPESEFIKNVETV
tara:strand:- start:129 stop:317 length:189 start_codon:yes stop_codon:yes gene_type:complete